MVAPGNQQIYALAALLSAVSAIEDVRRRLHPPDIALLAERVRRETAPLARILDAEGESAWDGVAVDARAHLQRAAGFVLAAAEGVDVAMARGEGYVAASRALRIVTLALETLYPLTQQLPALDRFFLEPGDDASSRMPPPRAPSGPRGVMHVDNGREQRGGYSLYVPEDFDQRRTAPLVVALHGGSGHGADFLWSWLRAARTRGAILVAPTSQGRTWSLRPPDVDSPRLAEIVGQVERLWPVDRRRVLLTGMSDGGTFTLRAGFDESAPFTHLAAVAASVGRLAADVQRLPPQYRRPIFLVHGALDWMFPVSTARLAAFAMRSTGADLVYREIEDLSHAYPGEVNLAILDWLQERPGG